MNTLSKMYHRVKFVEGLVDRSWYLSLVLREHFTKKIRVGFGPVVTGEDNLAERKWRIDPIVNEINRRGDGYSASCFFYPEEMKKFDLIVIVKRFTEETTQLVSSLKGSGKKFIYDIVDNPNAGPKHRIFFADAPPFSSQMDGFILSSPLHADAVKKFSACAELIEHPVIHSEYKTSYSLGDKIRVLAQGYYENLKPIRLLEPLFRKVSKEIHQPIEILYHSERKFADTESIRCIPWTVENAFSTLLSADFAVSIKNSNDPFQWAKPSTKLITYLAAGLPVICTPTPADQLVGRHDETVLFAKTEEEWSKFIRLLCTDKFKRKQLGIQGRNSVLERYSIQAITEKYIALFNRVIEK